MTVTRAIAVLVAVTVLVAGVGCGIGYVLGRLNPAYYRSVFQGGQDPGFDPVSVGVGQGLTQGAVGGVVAGLLVIALLCWRDVRLQRTVGDSNALVRSVRRGTSARLLFIVGGLLVLIFCTGVGLLVGNLTGARGANHRRYIEEQQALAPVLAADASFSAIQIAERSRGGACLVGRVQSAEDLERLRAAVTRAVGEARADEMLAAISVRK